MWSSSARSIFSSLCRESSPAWSRRMLSGGIIDKESVPDMNAVRKQLIDFTTPEAGETRVVSRENDMTPGSPESTYTRAIRRLSQNQKQYGVANKVLHADLVRSNGAIRIGRVLEDLDFMVVLSSFKHVLAADMDMTRAGTCPPIGLVTAVVDQIVFHKHEIGVRKDLLYEAHIDWVGKSSLEGKVVVKEDNDGTWMDVVEATFLMCARDNFKNTSMQIRPLVLSTEQEKAEFEAGEMARVKRQTSKAHSLIQQGPTSAENDEFYSEMSEFMDSSRGSFRTQYNPEDFVWMHEARRQQLIYCFPQQTNMYSKIFGGFLMRKMYEIAYGHARKYAKTQNVQIEKIDDIVFRTPVNVDDELHLTSQVVHTSRNKMVLRVHAEVEDLQSGQRNTTNKVHMIFSAPHDVKKVFPFPRPYLDILKYIESKRILQQYNDE